MKNTKAKFSNKVKEQIYERDGKCCIFCGANSDLHFHHCWFGTESFYGKGRNNVSQGICCCATHHREIHGCSKGQGLRKEAIDYLNNYYGNT